MNDLWSAFYERVTLARQHLRSWVARAAGGGRIEGLYPDSFWDEVAVRSGSTDHTRGAKRRFRVLAAGQHSLLMVKHRAPGIQLYFDHVNERQREWMGRGRRDVTGRRVPIYGTMVLRANPETLIDRVIGDELLWDELRRVVMPQVANAERRAVEWRRYWVHAHLDAPLAHWQSSPETLRDIIRVLGSLAARLEGIERPVKEEPS